MLFNYLKIAFRNLTRHKAFSLINISGLAIGMACSIFILLWVRDELSYDQFHENADRMYRLTCNAGEFKAAVSPAGFTFDLKSRLPAINNLTRISKPQSALFTVGEHKFQEKQITYVDSNFFELFNFRLIRGDVKSVLDKPDGILITENMARKYFGDEDPVGKIIRKDNQENYRVTGVLANIPSNSHVQFDFIIPMSAIEKTDYDLVNHVWTNFNYYAYLLLDKNTKSSTDALSNLGVEMDNFFKSKVKDFDVHFHLQPLRSIHLTPALQVDLPGHGNIQYVNLFFIVALLFGIKFERVPP